MITPQSTAYATNAYRQLIERARATGDDVLRRAVVVGPDAAHPAVVAQITPWANLSAQLDSIPAALSAFIDASWQAQTNSELRPEAVEVRIEVAAATLTTTLDRIATDTETRIDGLLESLRAASLPSRPEPVDATQEAALAGLKSDLRMVFDNKPADEHLPSLIAERLDRALIQRDDLAAWLLGATDWPADYLDARGLTHHAAAFDAQAAARLDEHMGGRTKSLRADYRRLAHPRAGLPAIKGALILALNTIAPQLIEWRLGGQGDQIKFDLWGAA